MNTDRSVFITGGGTGLGAAVAKLLASQGWRIGLAGRRAQVLGTTRDELLAMGAEGKSYVLDVSKAAPVAEAIEDFAPTALVNAAAVLGQGDILETMTPEHFAMVQSINVQGSFNTCWAAMRLWHRQQRPGDIVNVTSLGGLRGMQAFPGFSAYAASKHAVVGLTEALAMDGKAHDIRVNAIAPGMMRTDMLAQMGITPATLPEQIAPTVAYLLDREASGPLSGTTIDIHCND